MHDAAAADAESDTYTVVAASADTPASGPEHLFMWQRDYNLRHHLTVPSCSIETGACALLQTDLGDSPFTVDGSISTRRRCCGGRFPISSQRTVKVRRGERRPYDGIASGRA